MTKIMKFFYQLQETLDTVQTRDIKIVMGDMNAKVGISSADTSTYETCAFDSRNERGDSMVDFCKADNLVLANTIFDQHPR